MTNLPDRLERIKAECEKRGIDGFDVFMMSNGLPVGGSLHTADLRLVEALLAATSPDVPTITIRQLTEGFTEPICNCDWAERCCWNEVSIPEPDFIANPGPSCPGPADDGYEYVLGRKGK